MTDQTPQASSQIRIEAERCAASAPVGLIGVDDILIAVKVIDLAYRWWQSCTAVNTHEAAQAAASSAMPADENDHIKRIQLRKARRRVRRAAKIENYPMSEDRLQGLTLHMLSHVKNAEPASLAACCAEPMIKDEVDD